MTCRRSAGPRAALVALTLAAGLVLVQGCGRQDSGPTASLTLYCAAGMQPPVEAIAAEYSRRYGVVTQIQYGGSGTLLSSLQIASTGDLYLAADETYLERARDLGLVAEILPVARMRPVIAVAASNPKGIVTIDDLLREDVEVALANPDAASVGKNTKRILTATGHWAALSHHARVFKPTVNDVANDVRLGAVDAGVIWDATANQYDGLDGVHVPEFDAEAMVPLRYKWDAITAAGIQIVGWLPVLVTPDGTVRAWEGMRWPMCKTVEEHTVATIRTYVPGYEPIPGPVLIDPADMPGEWVEWVRREVFGG